MQNYVFQFATTNRPPSVHEKHALLNLITDQEMDIARIESQIIDAEIHINQLRAQLDHRVRRVHELKGFFSPLRRIPVELLAKIFRYCHILMPTYSFVKPGFNIMHRGDAQNNSPLLMCQVCSTWRNVAISMPELWDTLYFPFDPRIGRPGITIISLKELYAGAATRLSRAGNSDVKLFIESPPNTNENERLAEEAFRPFSHIIASINVDEVSCRYINDGILHSGVPRLQNLIIESTNEDDLKIMANMPWSQLTVLNVSGTELLLMPTSEVLSMCINLVECDLSLASDQIDPSLIPPLPVATLPNLTKLVVAFNYQPNADGLEFCSHFFDALKLPALTHFSINLRPGFDERLMRFKERSSLQLKSFYLENSTTSGRELVEFLDGMPDLSSIHLEDVVGCLDLDLIYALTLDHANRIGTLAPNLAEFDAENHCGGHRDNSVFDSIINMIESWSSRSDTSGIGIATKVRLSFGGPYSRIWHPSKDFRARLDACKVAGMDLTHNQED